MSVIRKNVTTKTGFQVAVRFTVNQHSRDTPLFNIIQKYLNCGIVSVDYEKSVVTFSLSEFSSIINIIIPFFDKYTIQGVKLNDYFDFREIAFLMQDKVHLTNEGLNRIKAIKSKMNSKRDHNINL